MSRYKWLILLLMLPLVISCKGPQGVVVMNSELREVVEPDGQRVGMLVVVVENRTGQVVAVDYHVFLNGQLLAVAQNQQIFPQMANNQEFQIRYQPGYNGIILFVNTNVNIYPASCRSFVAFAP